MPTSKMIAGLIGPTFAALGLAVLVNYGSLPVLAAQISGDPALIFMSGILLFVAGIAIARAHNIWTLSWTLLVTSLAGSLSSAASQKCCFQSRLA